MKMSSATILHLSESLTRLGGCEIFLNNWLQSDTGSRAAALLDSQRRLDNPESQIGLRPNRLYSLARIRSFVRSRHLQCKTLICHNFAGLTALSDLIECERLVVYLHTNSADVWPRVLRLAPFVDGYVACGNGLAGEVKKLLGESPVTVASFDSPFDDAFFLVQRPPKSGGILIGYAGRLVIEQKRVDRLREFCQALLAQGVDFRLQITGDGPDQARLARLLAPFPVEFLGLLKREDLFGTFAAWDFQIITSDYETGPLTSLEGMACGIVPILPDIDCQAADLVRGRFNHLLYPVGKMAEAANCLRLSASQSPSTMESLRSDLRRLVAPRSMKNNLHEAYKTLAAIHAKPSVRKKFYFQTSWQDLLPMAVRCRLSGGSEFLK